MPGNTPRVADQADKFSGRLGSGALGKRRAADEVAWFAELDDPAEADIERRNLSAEFVAVQGHAGFQPQRVPRRKARRDQTVAGASLSQRLPHLDRVLRADEDLEAVVACVAGPGKQRTQPGDGGGMAGIVADLIKVGAGEPGEYAGRTRALDRDQGVVGRAVGHGGTAARDA